MNELHYESPSLIGQSLYAILWNESGEAWNGSAFATWTGVHAAFDIAATDANSVGYWLASMPVVVAGNYRWKWYVGGEELAVGSDYWNGSAFGAVASVTGSVGSLANQAAFVTAVGAEVGTVIETYDVATESNVNSLSSQLTTLLDEVGDVPTDTATALAPTLSTIQTTAGSAEAAANSAAADAILIRQQTDLLDYSGAGGALKSESTNMRGTDNALLASSYSAPPTTQQIRDAMKLAPSGGAAASGSIDDKIDDIESGSGITIPVIQVPVPSSRTWILKNTGDGLVGELPIVRMIGESQLMAIDWRADLPNNGRLISLDDIQFIGMANGIVIDPQNQGVDRSQSKFFVECVAAGEYTITSQVTFDDSDGGGTSIGTVTLIVK